MHVVIIGNGISGITAARWIRKLDEESYITVVSDEGPHFYSRTALMYIYMGHMRYQDTKPYEDWFWEKNRIDLVQDRVVDIDFTAKYLKLKGNGNLQYDQLIIAVGSKSNKFGWPGQDLAGVSGLYHLQDLAQMEKYSEGLERAVIVGGGLIGIEMAEMFHSREIAVTMLVREESYWNNVLPAEESAMVSRHIKDHHIDLRLGTNLQEIIDAGNGKAGGVIVKESGEKIECGYVGLTPGVSPNVDFLRKSELDIDKGILVDEYLKTNIPNVYAIGDCAQLVNPQPGRRSIEAVWYTGRMMGETVAHTITGKKVPYNPGIWYNSAKFIDLEYQVYGDVPPEISDDVKTIYWESTEGNKSIRINYAAIDGQVLGFNLMGVRYRHQVCEKWIKDKSHIEEVISQLSLANFDPEFYKMHEQSVIEAYNQQTGKNLKSKEKRNLGRVLSFLKQ